MSAICFVAIWVLMLSRVSGVSMVTRSVVFVLCCSSFGLTLVTCLLFGSLLCGGLMLSRASGVTILTRSEVFVLGVVRLSRVASCSFSTCMGRVGLGAVMVSKALCAVGFLLVGWVIRLMFWLFLFSFSFLYKLVSLSVISWFVKCLFPMNVCVVFSIMKLGKLLFTNTCRI